MKKYHFSDLFTPVTAFWYIPSYEKLFFGAVFRAKKRGLDRRAKTMVYTRRR